MSAKYLDVALLPSSPIGRNTFARLACHSQDGHCRNCRRHLRATLKTRRTEDLTESYLASSLRTANCKRVNTGCFGIALAGTTSVSFSVSARELLGALARMTSSWFMMQAVLVLGLSSPEPVLEPAVSSATKPNSHRELLPGVPETSRATPGAPRLALRCCQNSGGTVCTFTLPLL